MVYLDYASTYPYMVHSENDAKEYEFHANPNANYAYVDRAILQSCEARIKRAIGVEQGHILYFRTATDCIEWLHDAVIKKNPSTSWGHSPYEHDCCLYGDVTMENKDFYIHQLVNHITGDIFDPLHIGLELDRVNKDVEPMLILDATAAINHIMMPEDLDDLASALFMSGHKIGCPDISFMWLNNDLFNLLGGGNDIRNQYGLKHGSLSVRSIKELADTVECIYDNFVKFSEYINETYYNLYARLCCELEDNNIEYDVIGKQNMATATINAIRLHGINADALQQFLATKKIYIGIGHSSCAGEEDYRVLVDGYGLSKQEASEIIRASFGEDSSVEDVEALVEGIKNFKELYVK